MKSILHYSSVGASLQLVPLQLLTTYQQFSVEKITLLFISL